MQQCMSLYLTNLHLITRSFQTWLRELSYQASVDLYLAYCLTAGDNFRTDWIHWCDWRSRTTRLPWWSRSNWFNWTFRDTGCYRCYRQSRWSWLSWIYRRYRLYRISRLVCCNGSKYFNAFNSKLFTKIKFLLALLYYN